MFFLYLLLHSILPPGFKHTPTPPIFGNKSLLAANTGQWISMRGRVFEPGTMHVTKPAEIISEIIYKMHGQNLNAKTLYIRIPGYCM